MSINGAGEVARDWAETLERLTMRPDLRFLTLRAFAQGLPTWGLQRNIPQWCPHCYDKWREQKQPVYQPLIWTLQAVTVCMRHAHPLIERCPFCQKAQSVLAAKTLPGSCTQCGIWLGSALSKGEKVDVATLDWQGWVRSAIEELYHASRAFSSLPWDQLSKGIAACVEAVGGCRELGRLMQASKMLFSGWLNGQRTPSFSYLLEIGYVLDITPLQLMTVEPEQLKKGLLSGMIYRQFPHARHRMPASKGNVALMQQFIQSVLSGVVEPLSVRRVARHLGVGEKFLVGRFPQECAQITMRYQAYCAERAKQRVTQECLEVRQAVRALDEQGILLSRSQVTARLSNPHILRRPEGKATWHAIRRERGLEP